MEHDAQKMMEESKCQGILCTGQHGLLLTSAGIADASKAGFFASLISTADSLHNENIAPIVVIESESW